jgi:hypothetical protein
MGINDRFYGDNMGVQGISPVTPLVIYQSITAVAQAAVANKDVAAIHIPKGQFGPGATFRVTMAGTKSGANVAMAVALSIDSTAILTLTADDVTAVDWVAVMTITGGVNLKAQKAFGTLDLLTSAPVADYAAGTSDCTGEVVLRAQIYSGHTSDTITCEYILIEYWNKVS